MVFYDGGCGLCSREIAHYRRLDSRERIEWIDITREPERLEDFGLELQACMEVLHVIAADGRRHTGAYAFAVTWSQLPGYRWLARLVRLPGILPLLDAAYRRFARWRFRRRTACAVN
jgi:predicted DCC family thiol-disulfide oxidoreductase YuxK